MRKRLLSITMATVLTASLLVGCGASEKTDSVDDSAQTQSTSETPSAGENPMELTVWAPFVGSDGDVLREIINDYNETNEDNVKITIDIMHNDILQSKLPTAVSTQTGPDFVLVGIEHIKQYAENGLIEDISDFWEVQGIDKSNFYENVVAKSYIGDTLYGVPMQYNLQYLYYNKDVFTAAGLDPEAPPATMEELREAAIACTDASINQYGLGLPTDYLFYCAYLWANGGDVIDAEGTKNLLNSKENIDTLTWIQEMILENGVSPQGLTATDSDTMFQSGQLAMYTSGPWNINALTALGVNYGIAAIPAGTAGSFSPEGGCSFMLIKGADDATKAAVYDFMAYWLSDETLKEWSMRNGFPVWSYSLLEDEDIKNNAILSSVSAASEIGRDWHLGLEIGSRIDNDVMIPMMEKILAGEDVETSLKEASDILDEIIASK